MKGHPTGIEFIDSTNLKVCHNMRIPRHKVFKDTAARGKGTMGWFYGFQLHIIVNHVGDIVAAKLTQAISRMGQSYAGQKIHNRDNQRPAKEHIPNRALEAS